MTEEFRTPHEWLKHPEFKGTVILDPDGWRGKGAPPLSQAIPYSEFVKRLNMCTSIKQNGAKS